MSFFVLCMEFPIFHKCFRAGSAGYRPHSILISCYILLFREQYILAFQAPVYHGILYAIFAGILGISFASSFSLLIVPFLLLTLASISYLIAYFASEDTVRSRLTFGAGLNQNNRDSSGQNLASKDPKTVASMEAGQLNL
jgi:hypothetical protein